MTELVCPDLERLSAAALGEEGQGSDARAHLSGCEPCRRRVERLEALLAFPRSAEPPPAVLAAVLQGIERDTVATAADAPAPVAPSPIRVGLACTWCHGQTARDEAAFCATCLAAHHQDCFEKHGRCSAPGCAETRFVRAQLPGARPIRRSRRAIVPLLVAASFGCASVVMVRQYVQTLQREHQLSLMLKPAYVAARDIPTGAMILEEDIATADFPGQAMERMFGSSRITDKSTIIGAGAATDIRVGQVFTRDQFVPRGGGVPGMTFPAPPLTRRIAHLAWSKAMPGACAPIIGEGDRVFAHGADGLVACYERSTGRLVWGYSGPGPDHVSGFLAGALLVTLDANGHLRARYAVDGMLAWQRDLDVGTIVAGPLLSPDQGRIHLAGEKSGLVCISAFDGRDLWRNAGIRVAGVSMAHGPGGRLLAAFPRRELTAFHPGGQPAWRLSLPSAPDGILPMGSRMLLWAADGSTCAAESPPEGQQARLHERSTLTLPGKIRGLARSGEQVVAALDTGELVGFRPGEPEVLWRQPVSRSGLGPPADAGGGEVLVVDQDGQVFLAAADHSRTWRVQLPARGGSRHPPVRDPEGRVFVATEDAVHCLDH